MSFTSLSPEMSFAFTALPHPEYPECPLHCMGSSSYTYHSAEGSMDSEEEDLLIPPGTVLFRGEYFPATHQHAYDALLKNPTKLVRTTLFTPSFDAAVKQAMGGGWGAGGKCVIMHLTMGVGILDQEGVFSKDLEKGEVRLLPGRYDIMVDVWGTPPCGPPPPSLAFRRRVGLAMVKHRSLGV